MSLELAIVTGILMGFVFGFAMEKSRVFEPGMIVGQMQLRNFIMLKVFLTAVATGAVVLAVLNGFGFVKLAPKAALYYADVAVGLILGAGNWRGALALAALLVTLLIVLERYRPWRSDLGQDWDGYFAEPGDRVAERATGRGGIAVGGLGAPEGRWE